MMLTIGEALTGMFLFLLAYNLPLKPPRLDEAHFMNKSIPILPFILLIEMIVSVISNWE